MDFLLNLASNIIANIIFWFGLGFVAWMWVRFRQESLLGFFGLQRNNKKLVVYLSNLWKPTTERPEGYVLSWHEFRVTEIIPGLFGSTTFRVPELVRGFVDSFWLGKRVDISTTVSPYPPDSFSFTNMIIIGGSIKNNVRKYYHDRGMVFLSMGSEQNENKSSAWIDKPMPKVLVLKGSRKDEIFSGDYHYAIVEKIHDKEHQSVVFMCIGCRGDYSWAATEYLARHWNELRKRFGNDAFAICLGFPKTEIYMDKYEEPVIIASFPS